MFDALRFERLDDGRVYMVEEVFEDVNVDIEVVFMKIVFKMSMV